MVGFVATRLEAVCQEIADYARGIAPVRTGQYANSIHVEAHGELQYSIVADAPHAAIVEFGSSPHFILPVNVKALKFEVDGETVFAKWVMHPGTAPQMIIHRAKKDNMERLVEAIRDGVRDALAGK